MFDGPVELVGAVTAFRGAYFALSNFYPHPITVDGHRYATVEHYFQAQKAVDPLDHDRIRDAETPAEAKRLGRLVRCVEDWPQRKVAVMRRALAAKFTVGSEPGAFLLSTGTAPLVEGNDWGDEFWGVCDGRGHNTLGVLLTERRGVLHHERLSAGAIASLLVIYSEQLDVCRDFYAGIGLPLVREQHGAGPVHYSSELAGGLVLELYPGRPKRTTGRLRLGLTVTAGVLSPGEHNFTDPDGRAVVVTAS